MNTFTASLSSIALMLHRNFVHPIGFGWLLFLFCLVPIASIDAQNLEPVKLFGDWLTHPNYVGKPAQPNTWLLYEANFELKGEPLFFPVDIDARDQYWLWVNGNLLVRGGGKNVRIGANSLVLDSLNLSASLMKGYNAIQVLVWHRGESGSKAGGVAPALLFRAPLAIKDWLVTEQRAFKVDKGSLSGKTHAQAIIYDARSMPSREPLLDDQNQISGKQLDTLLKFAPVPNKVLVERDGSMREMSMDTIFPAVIAEKVDQLKAGRKMVRPETQTLQRFPEAPGLPFLSKGERMSLQLPSQQTVTAFFVVDAPRAGMMIAVNPDKDKGANRQTIYLTREGRQYFETPVSMQSKKVNYCFPAGVEVLDVGYRLSRN